MALRAPVCLLLHLGFGLLITTETTLTVLPPALSATALVFPKSLFGAGPRVRGRHALEVGTWAGVQHRELSRQDGPADRCHVVCKGKICVTVLSRWLREEAVERTGAGRPAEHRLLSGLRGHFAVDRRLARAAGPGGDEAVCSREKGGQRVPHRQP